MSPSLRLGGAVGLALLAAKTYAQTCVSYGVDFQTGGSYFQNITNPADFTFTSLFEGCQADICDNILVDPNGDEYQCSDTNLTPDDSAQMSTCPIEESQMYSGDWSVLLISNNGNGTPIAYERDFYLSVGTPVTTTFTPTVTLSATVTPLVNTTVYTTTTLTTTSTKVVTSPAVTKKTTVTVTPAKVTTTKTITETIRKTGYSVMPILTTKYHTESCVIPPSQPNPDPTCSITPTLVTAAALQTDASKKFRRVPDAIAVPTDRAQRIAERKARLAAGVEKRGLDQATTTVTDTNSADYPTSTTTITAAASTLTTTDIVSATSTSTITSTSFKGTTTLVKTVTAATPTRTATRYTFSATTVTTKVFTTTITISSNTFAPSASSVCNAKGGKMQ